MILGDQEFKKRYKNLNKEQKLAVDTIYGPVMVIAGPGTGKTTILTLRIAQILRLTDTPPEAILALTFTDSGAEAMRKKLSEIIGPIAFRVKIGTFHSFAGELISSYPNFFSKIIGGRLLNEIEQISIIRNILDNKKFEKLTPQGDRFYYTKKIISAIKHLKLENLTPTDFEKFTKNEVKELEKLSGQKKATDKKNDVSLLNKLKRNLDLVKIYREYENQLRGQKLYDFEDILIETVSALKENSEFLAEIRENIHFIMADEHQDANGAQNEILEILSSYDDNPNLFIVGDEKQAIYRFQGASLENFLYFKNKFQNAKTITLINNYRSDQNILDASHSLALKLDQSKEIERPRLLGLPSPENLKLEISSFISSEAEMDFVLHQALEFIKKGKKTAILVRENRDIENFVKYAKRLKIKLEAENHKEIFNDPDIFNLITILKTINDPTDNQNLAETLFIDFLNLKIKDVFRIFREIKNKKKDRKYLIDIIQDKKFLDELYLDNGKLLPALAHKIENWSSKAKNLPLSEILDLIAKESGFVSKIIGQKSLEEKILVYDTLHRFVSRIMEGKKNAKLQDFIESLELLETHNARISAKIELKDDTKIQIMTAHRSKGLEFDVVFIAGAFDGHFGGKSEKTHFILPNKTLGQLIKGNESDERRLFYVAITRAKERVYISYPNTSVDGKILIPSRFIMDLKQKLITEKDKTNYEQDFLKILEKENIKNTKNKPLSDILEYTNLLFLEQGLNATAINNYLKCPWHYFFKNLIRVPERMAEHLIFGNAIHEAIHFFLVDLKSKKNLTKTKLENYFENSLKRASIDSKTEKRLLERGKKSTLSLSNYLKDYINKDFLSEYKISGIPLLLKDKTEIKLTGKLDIVEKIDGGYKVLDFKTGKPKSRNHILGNTKDSNGDIYRQLIFYKILLENKNSGLGKMQIGEICFVENEKQIKPKTEIFTPEEKEKNELLIQIQEIAENILKLGFWNQTCNNPDCEDCKMATIMKNAL